MDFRSYQKKAITTDVWGAKIVPIPEIAFMDKLLGLVGETGEIAEKFKKILRDKKGVMTEDDRKEMSKELGDVLWYLAVVAHYLELDLEDIADANIAKLFKRKEEGKLRGSGDNR